MGMSEFFGEAYVKSQIAAGNSLPNSGKIFISVNDYDKKSVVPIARKLVKMGYEIWATLGTFSRLHVEGVKANLLQKLDTGTPNVLEMINNGEIRMIINTPMGRKAYQHDKIIRSAALQKKVLCITNIAAAKAATEGMEWIRKHQIKIHSPIKNRM